MRLDAHVRVEPPIISAALATLGAPTCGRVVHDLALQVVERYAVVVDDADGADAGGGQIHQHRRAEPARADHEHLGGLELLLALAADLAQHQVTLVALDLFVVRAIRLACSVVVPRRPEL